MKKPGVILYTLLVLLLRSCGLLSEVSQKKIDASPGVPATPFVPEGAVPPAPMPTGEGITCTHFVSPTGDDAKPGSETRPWSSFQYALDSAQPGDCDSPARGRPAPSEVWEKTVR